MEWSYLKTKFKFNRGTAIYNSKKKFFAIIKHTCEFWQDIDHKWQGVNNLFFFFVNKSSPTASPSATQGRGLLNLEVGSEHYKGMVDNNMPYTWRG